MKRSVAVSVASIRIGAALEPALDLARVAVVGRDVKRRGLRRRWPASGNQGDENRQRPPAAEYESGASRAHDRRPFIDTRFHKLSGLVIVFSEVSYLPE